MLMMTSKAQSWSILLGLGLMEITFNKLLGVDNKVTKVVTRSAPQAVPNTVMTGILSLLFFICSAHIQRSCCLSPLLSRPSTWGPWRGNVWEPLSQLAVMSRNTTPAFFSVLPDPPADLPRWTPLCSCGSCVSTTSSMLWTWIWKECLVLSGFWRQHNDSSSAAWIPGSWTSRRSRASALHGSQSLLKV